MDCIVCEKLGIEGSPSDIHHVTECGRRLGEFYILPICPPHHRLAIDCIGICSGSKAFEEEYGFTEEDLLEEIWGRAGLNINNQRV